MSPASTESQVIRDVLDPARAAALHAALARPGPAPGPGDPLPPFWHQIYFWDPRPPAALGRDGHPAVGAGLIPDLGLPVRMWAGGRLKFLSPVRLGASAERRSQIEKISNKQGRSGPLGFVTIRHEIWQDGQLCLTEHQDIVYRSERTKGSSKLPLVAPTNESVSRKVAFDTTLLFRYSALTFNGHRIHHDLDYATQVECYGGLVVHGPLLAQLLVHLAEDQIGSLRSFSFRATSPLMHYECADLCWRDGALWVRGPDGRLCMEAAAG